MLRSRYKEKSKFKYLYGGNTVAKQFVHSKPFAGAKKKGMNKSFELVIPLKQL